MKNKFEIFTVILIACIFILGNKVYAFTSSDYYANQNISIGLVSSESSQLSITLNGNYTLNGVACNSGTSYILKASGSQLSLNGVLQNNISFIPSTSTSTIRIASKNYKGRFIFKIDSSSGTSKVLPVNTIYIEDYLKGVVGKEMSNSFPIEALKAQAVAARNYALANIGKHDSKGYDLCDTIDCQVYGGYDGSMANVILAVDSTKGKVLLSGTSIVNAYYSANDGGYTEASENVWLTAISYLKSKQDSYDVNYIWHSDYSTTTINTLLKIKTSLKIPLNYTFVNIDLNNITKFNSGRIKNINMIFKDQYGVLHTISYGKETARTFLNLESALYNVTYNIITDSYTFNGKGNGHGVGMSQIGAKNRAIAGQNYVSILKFYYDGTTLFNSIVNYTITFNSQGGNAVSSKISSYNSVITIPTPPTRSGYTFGGWYKEAGGINAWNFTLNRVIANTTLYAKWTIIAAVVPQNLTATSSSYNSIKTSWSAAYGASGYEIYRATSSVGPYTLITAPTGLSFNNTGLTTNTTYYYKVRSYKMVGTLKVRSGYSAMVSAKPIQPLPALAIPANLKATSSSYNSINTSWSAVAGASGYEIYRATSSAGPYTSITAPTGLSFNNTGLTTNTTYYYEVRSYKMVGTVKVRSGYSAMVSAKPIQPLEVLAIPANLKATSSSYNSINTSWSAIAGASGYEIYRATSSAGPFTLITAPTGLSFNNIGLTTNTTYYYRVRSYKMIGIVKVRSGYSAMVSAKPIQPLEALAIPANLKATSSSYNSINTSWSAVAGVSGYEIYRATSSAGPFTLITAPTGLSFNNTGLTTNTTYYYKVRSYKMVGIVKVRSGYSSTVSAKPIPVNSISMIKVPYFA